MSYQLEGGPCEESLGSVDGHFPEKTDVADPSRTDNKAQLKSEVSGGRDRRS